MTENSTCNRYAAIFMDLFQDLLSESDVQLPENWESERGVVEERVADVLAKAINSLKTDCSLLVKQPEQSSDT